ncbi:MAG: RNA-guided endonuclease TnpB family protein [Candidatus Hodarchaeota archaeon]
MLVDVAYRFRIYPNEVQEEILNKTFGCCRFLWNRMLAEHNNVYERLKDNKNALYTYKYKTEKQYKQEFGFLKVPDSKALQNVNRNLFQAYQNFFDGVAGKRPRVGYPRFKSKHGKQSYITNNINDNIKIDFKRRTLKLPKIDAWFSYRDNRVFDEKIRKLTVSKTKSGKYFASISFKREVSIQEKTTIQESKIAAFDMSCKEFMVDTSNNRFINPRFYRKQENKLKKLHRDLSRKQKGSSNQNKARVKLAELYDKIGNQRNDWQHKLSIMMARTYDAILLEDLNIDGMKQFNSAIAKTVTLDFSWGAFTRMLDYKMQRHGKHLVKVGRFYPSSKLCSNCGYKHDALKLSDREWTCPGCGMHHERDENASKTIWREGARILQEERSIKIIKSSTVGTTGSHASGDRVRPVTTRAMVDEGRIHAL